MTSNNNTQQEQIQSQPTLLDIFNLLKNCVTKNDLLNQMDEMKNELRTQNLETQQKFDSISERIVSVEAATDQNNDKIESLEVNIELLKQDQLKNHISISGVPTEFIKNKNTNEVVIAIAKTIGIELTQPQFSSHAAANDKIIITNMHNTNTKQLLLNKIRAKKSLMVEEVFSTQSNSQIYLNEQLTPYFGRIYQIARKAKKEKKIASVSSNGGKIRIRKNQDDTPITITTENQLKSLIDSNENSETNTNDVVQRTANVASTSQTTQTTAAQKTTSTSNSRNNNNHKSSAPFLRSAKRKGENEEIIDNAKKLCNNK